MNKRRQAKTAQSVYFDHKDVDGLNKHIDRFGQIESRYRTGLKETQQRHLSRAIKRARHLALMPFVGRNQLETNPPASHNQRKPAKEDAEKPTKDSAKPE